jgi:hypothetical protein
MRGKFAIVGVPSRAILYGYIVLFGRSPLKGVMCGCTPYKRF